MIDRDLILLLRATIASKGQKQKSGKDPDLIFGFAFNLILSHRPIGQRLPGIAIGCWCKYQTKKTLVFT